MDLKKVMIASRFEARGAAAKIAATVGVGGEVAGEEELRGRGAAPSCPGGERVVTAERAVLVLHRLSETGRAADSVEAEKERP